MNQTLVYTAQSKHFFYCRDAVCEFVFRRGAVPLNPFRAFDYFLNDRVPREQVRKANHRLITAADEVWVFGDQLADGVIVEIAQAAHMGSPVRFFSIGAKVSEILELRPEHLKFESEVSETLGLTSHEMRDFVVSGEVGQLVSALGRRDEVFG